MSVAAALAASQAETEHEDEVERTRLTMMRRYAEHTDRWRSFLLSYFGQDYPARAGTATTTSRMPSPAKADVPFAIGARVVSQRWGAGTV